MKPLLLGSNTSRAVDEVAEHVASSAVFSRSKRHAGLLKFLAMEMGTDLKETVIGHRFFERPVDYDPKVDPVVRVEIRRLRDRLGEYYTNGGGSADPWRLELPKGSYRLLMSKQAESAPPKAPASDTRDRRLWWIAAAIVATLAIVCAGLLWRSGAAQAPIRSIAVLEFETKDDPQATMAAGLASEIAAALAPVEGLLVVGPAASARAQARSQDLRQMARDLHVDSILSGRIETLGSRMRLQMRITRPEDGAVLWAQSEQQVLVDPFALQSEFAARVAAVVNRKLLRRPRAEPHAPPAAALLDYRRGKLQIERRTGPAILRGIALFRSATQKDPQYAAGWSALADAAAMAPDYVLAEGHDWAEEARRAARRALQIDPENVEAYVALGWVDFSHDLKIAEARHSLLRALRLNPNHLAAQRRLGLIYLSVESFAAAEQAMRAALRLDPLSPIAQINLAELYQAKGDLVAQERVLREVLEANPTFELGQVMLAVNFLQTGRCAEASAIARPLLRNKEALDWQPPMANVMARCGDAGPARAMAARNQPAGSADMLSATLGDWPRARRYFAEAVAHQPLRALNLGLDKVWMSDPVVRRDYAALRERMRAADR